jgi:exodeoxyribonuclease VII large subunit
MVVPAISVSDYLGLINLALGTIPEEVVVEGEIVEYKVSQGKWINFDLKDEKADAKISCFATIFQLTTPLASGMRVQARGYAKVFERFGKLSFNVEEVTPVGEGALQKAYQLLKAKLQAEGLFDAPRKRAIPRFPNTIGLITSREAAAYGDFLRILGNRWRGVTVIHSPVTVQGKSAVAEILAAFTIFNAMPAAERPEVIVLTRGGGSLEDLHAFNDEQVARAVFGSAVPVVVGVGHERDESLCDFVADIRASTPSNAAERVVPDHLEIERAITAAMDRVTMQLERTVERRSNNIDYAVRVIDRFMADKTPQLNRMTEVIEQRFSFLLSTRNARLTSAEKFLASVDPKRVLERGYSIVRHRGTVMRNASSLADGDLLQLQFAHGEIAAVAKASGKIQDKLL